MNITSISAIITIISGFIFLISIASPKSHGTIEVGDVFAGSNPGSTDNPNENPDPFVMIYEVQEIKDENLTHRWV